MPEFVCEGHEVTTEYLTRETVGPFESKLLLNTVEKKPAIHTRNTTSKSLNIDVKNLPRSIQSLVSCNHFHAVSTARAHT